MNLVFLCYSSDAVTFALRREGSGEAAQQVEVAELDDVSLSLGSHMVEGENSKRCPLTSVPQQPWHQSIN